MKILSENQYFKLLRVNHWFKNLFLCFGVLVGLWYTGASLEQTLVIQSVVAFFLASTISSVNYIVNQITDAKFDLRHPIKKKRPIPSGKLSAKSAAGLGVPLFMTSIWVAFNLFPASFVLALLALWVAGLAYNIRPVRLKDIPFIDVLAESINNPIRFLLGWFIVLPSLIPPLSILLLTWTAGAVLMGAKRYDELRVYGKKLIPYRPTFKTYSLKSIELSLYFYVVLTLTLFAYIGWRYQQVLLLAWPPTAILIIWFVRQILSGRVKARFG